MSPIVPLGTVVFEGEELYDVQGGDRKGYIPSSIGCGLKGSQMIQEKAVKTYEQKTVYSIYTYFRRRGLESQPSLGLLCSRLRLSPLLQRSVHHFRVSFSLSVPDIR